MSVDKKVEELVRNHKAGSILMAEGFRSLGSAGAVKVALHRLVKRGELKRLARGIYAKPKYDKLVGEVLPTAEEVAKAIAKRDKARIIPTGSYALHVLGLSTQIPLNLVYLTDGSPRKITVGKKTILFKKTSPKNLALKGKISRLVVQAFKEIGKNEVGTIDMKRMLGLLKKEDPKVLMHDIMLAPQWVAEIMSKALRS